MVLLSYGMQVQVKHFLSILSMARGHGLLTSLSWILQNWLVEATIVLSNYGASMRKIVCIPFGTLQTYAAFSSLLIHPICWPLGPPITRYIAMICVRLMYHGVYWLVMRKL
uniref:Uncharacterized protein n=1 Tax=Opuntia streptacantha TaxID=393608 RepID=A0A7C9ATA3_OPUST